FLIHAARMGAAGMGLSNDLRERVVEAVVLGGLSRNQAVLHRQHPKPQYQGRLRARCRRFLPLVRSRCVIRRPTLTPLTSYGSPCAETFFVSRPGAHCLTRNVTGQI